MRKIVYLMPLLFIMFFYSFKESKMFSIYTNTFYDRGFLFLDNFEKTFVFGRNTVFLSGYFIEKKDTLILKGTNITDKDFNIIESKDKDCIREIIFHKERGTIKDITPIYYKINEEDYCNMCYFPIFLYRRSIKQSKEETYFYKNMLWIVH